MLKIINKKQFEKDFELSIKRGKDIKKIKIVMNLLINNQTLPPKYKNHKLHGDYEGHWECHVQPDWLLVYIKTETAIIFVRTGSHSDLF